MRIGLTYNLKSEIRSTADPGLPEDAAEELDLPETVEALTEVFHQEGYEVIPLGGNLAVLRKLEVSSVDFVFNLAEGYGGRNREALIPALLELAGIPYSGSDPLALALTLDKGLTKRIALSLGIATPPFWIIEPEEAIDRIPNRFPLFVKPLWEGSSKGIRRSSRVENRSALAHEVKRLKVDYQGAPILVEEYVPGREITVGVVGNEPPGILGLMELSFKDSTERDFCYSLEVKRDWKKLVHYEFPALLETSTEKQICKAVRLLFKTLRLRDMARFDFRVNERGECFFLEVNPLPGLSPSSGDLVLLAQRKGWSYRKLILEIANTAMSRYPKLVF